MATYFSYQPFPALQYKRMRLHALHYMQSNSLEYGVGSYTCQKLWRGGQLYGKFFKESRQKCKWRVKISIRLRFSTCPFWPFSWPCHLSASTLKFLSCIVMFYSAPGEYWKIIHCRQAATWANYPSWPSTAFHRRDPLLPCGPSNRTRLDLSTMMTEGHRFDIHYSTVGAGGLKHIWCAMGIHWVKHWINTE